MIQYNFILNANSSAPVRSGLTFKVGDKGIVFKFQIRELDLTEAASAKIAFMRANGTSVESSITQSDGEYTYTLLGNELEVPGKTVADIKLYDSLGQRFSTTSFMFDVIADTLDGIGAGTSGYSDRLETLTIALQETLEHYEDAFIDTHALIAAGDYDPDTTYYPLNLVQYNGSSWVCRQICQGETPASGEYWQLLISGGGGSGITVDGSLSTTSVNPVQNRVITQALNGKAASSELAGKANKASGSAGNFAKLTADGNYEDSGKNEHSFAAASAMTAHEAEEVYSVNGVHGIRYYEDALQYFDGSVWVTIPTGGGGGSMTVDTAMSDSSTNAVQNKIIKAYVDASRVNITDSLDSTSAISALSANQGRVLDGKISTKADKVSGVTSGNFAGFDANGNLADSGKKGSDFEDAMEEVTGSAAITVTVADNTRYTYTSVSSLNMTGANVDCMGTITFGSSAPSISVSGFTDMDGDDITSAAASETWEFNVLGGRCLWKNWG